MKKIIKFLIPRTLLNYIIGSLAFFSLKWFKLKYGKIVLRKNTTDKSVYTSVFVLQEFKLPIKFSPKFIIDGGAYIGLSTLYFSNKYPQAEIVAIEPEASNFNILEVNTFKREKVSRIKAGIWYKKAFLKINNVNNEKWAFQVDEVKEDEYFDINSITLDSVLKASNYKYIDILKLDIEGAEMEVFSTGSRNWLNLTNVIILELHDRFKGGCSKAVYNQINEQDWDIYEKGEKVIFIRKNILNN